MGLWFRRGQRGNGKIGAIIALIVVIAVGYLIAKWVPVRTQSAEFQEFVERSARRFAISEINETQLNETIMDYAQKEKIPLKEDNIVINVTETKITVRVKYDYDIHLVGGKTWTQHYELSTETGKF